MDENIPETPPPAYDIAVLKLNSASSDTACANSELHTLSPTGHPLSQRRAASPVQVLVHACSTRDDHITPPPAYDNLSADINLAQDTSQRRSSPVLAPYFTESPTRDRSPEPHHSSPGNLSTGQQYGSTHSVPRGAIPILYKYHNPAWGGSMPITQQPSSNDDRRRHSREESSPFINGRRRSWEFVADDSSSSAIESAICELATPVQVGQVYVKDEGMVNAKSYIDHVSPQSILLFRLLMFLVPTTKQSSVEIKLFY